MVATFLQAQASSPQVVNDNDSRGFAGFSLDFFLVALV